MFADTSSEAPADQSTDSGSTQTAPAQQTLPGENTVFDKSRRVLSQNLITISRRIDAFFAGDRVLEESSGSYGCFNASLFFHEGGEIDSIRSACLKVDLPNTKKRWKLVITSDKDDDKDKEEIPGTETVESLATRDTGAFAGLRYIAQQEILNHSSFDIGIKAGTPVEPFARARFRRIWLPDAWLFRLTESLYWFKYSDRGVLSRWDMERKLSEKVHARITTEADYRDNEERFLLTQTIGVYREIKKGSALNVELQIYGTTDNPNTRVEFYVYRARYRFNLWRDWFFVEVSPQMLYQRETDFEADAGILFSAQAVFGNY